MGNSKVEEFKTLAENGMMLDVFEYFPAFMVVISKDGGEVKYCNHLAELIFGDITDKSFDEAFKEFPEFMDTLAERSTDRNLVFDQDISKKWYHISVTSAVWVTGVQSRVIVGFDITEIKNSEKRLAIHASTDLMTGLSNREAGLDFLDYYISDVNNSGNTFTVCYIDINDLKYVNDHFGHAEGDEYIKTVISCIKSSTRRTDVFARMGGDEFLIIFPNCRQEIVENIMGIVVNKLNFINEAENKIYSISYGIMEVNTETKLDAKYILSAADSKMYYMKEEFKKNRKPLAL